MNFMQENFKQTIHLTLVMLLNLELMQKIVKIIFLSPGKIDYIHIPGGPGVRFDTFIESDL